MPRRSKGWYWLAMALFALAIAVYAKHHDLVGLYAGYQHSEREVRDLEARLESLKAQEVALNRSVQRLNADPLAMERAIRGSKGLVRIGETVYRVELPEDYVP